LPPTYCGTRFYNTASEQHHSFKHCLNSSEICLTHCSLLSCILVAILQPILLHSRWLATIAHSNPNTPDSLCHKTHVTPLLGELKSESCLVFDSAALALSLMGI
jgi:hypothetical protein